MKKFVLLFVMTFALAGCQASNDAPAAPQGTVEEGTTQEAKAVATNPIPDAVKISRDEAIQVFAGQSPSASLDEFALDSENGVYYYEMSGFEGKNEYELTINATDASVIEKDRDKEFRPDNKALDLDLLKNIDTLVEEAMKDAGEGYVLKSYSVDYEEHGSFTKLDIELENAKGQDIEYEYNLGTQELLKKDH